MGLGINRGDEVLVLTGDDKGKRGKVLHVDRSEGRVIIQNVNYVWKHVRRSQKHPQGGRVQKEAPVHVSNVALVDSEGGKATRFRNELRDGKKVRVAARSGKPIGQA